MMNMLFSPSGRINAGNFMKGVAIIAVVIALISIVPKFNFGVGKMLGWVSLLTIIPLIFLYIKRSHDSGKSGWMSIVWLLIMIVVWFILAIIMSSVMPSPAELEMKAASEELAMSGAGFGEIMSAMKEMTMEYQEAIAQETAIRNAITALASLLLSGFLINLFNKHDPSENQYGPAN